ncbi:MAG: hypothetical protein U0441_11395 [Polyangiaceae bacterium]
MIPLYLVAWGITVVIESPIVAAFYPDRRARMGAVCAVATSLTNLSMNVLLPRWLGTGMTFLLVGEAAALLLEAAVYWLVAKPRDPGRALAASAVANSASFGAGLLLRGFL